MPELYAAGFRPSVGICPGRHYRHPDGRHVRFCDGGRCYEHRDRYGMLSPGHLGEVAAVLLVLPGVP